MQSKGHHPRDPQPWRSIRFLKETRLRKEARIALRYLPADCRGL
ncbi:hypothetical protein VB739_15330 [Cyanobium gracile UHCC 0281]|uniref:Uncharacterized protein n=1 Tax=Cyanobium gracile UHCC 0281 TaxID=3110309 RepID=A0ABU5T013_9CYAN|nr:hypothetical protein [Cyanobium gracile UHCC 0281]